MWAIGLALLAAAWGVVQVTPQEEAVEASFVESVAVGERSAGRELVVTVTDIRSADRVADDRGWAAEGAWVVVDLAAEARVSEVFTLLGTASLVVDGKTFRASERAESLLGRQLEVGVPTTGSVAFELPSELRERPAVLRLAANGGDLRLDSVVELAVDLSDLTREDSVQLLPIAGGGV